MGGGNRTLGIGARELRPRRLGQLSDVAAKVRLDPPFGEWRFAIIAHAGWSGG
jgi:hypothetical protein